MFVDLLFLNWVGRPAVVLLTHLHVAFRIFAFNNCDY